MNAITKILKPSPNQILLSLAGLPPISSTPHLSKVCETDSLECRRQVQNQSYCSLIFFPCTISMLSIFGQDLPYSSLSSSISAAGSVPIYAVLLLPLRHLWSSQGFPPTNQRRHKRPRPLTRDILRYQEEHHRACLVHFPLCSTFSSNSTTSSRVSFVTSKRTFG